MRFTLNDPETLAIIKRIHELSHDLKEVEALRAPSIRDIASAPIIDDWQLGSRSEPALIGVVQGHPLIKDGYVKTSGIYLLDSRMGYARTMTRWYRLGKPASSDSRN